jgi:hypothetical protein
VITLHPERWEHIEGSELEEGLLRDHLDVIAATDLDDRPREQRLSLRFRESPTRAVTVACIAHPGSCGDGFLPPMGPTPFTVEISQSPSESPEMEFLADRTALLYQRRLSGMLEHGESGMKFNTWGRFATYLSDMNYSWPAHLRRRIRHRFGTPEHLFESNIEIDGVPVDLALFPPRLKHVPEHAIWVFKLADRGDREARRRFKLLLRHRPHIRRGVLVAGDGLRCYERRVYPDGPRADRIPFGDLALTPDATFGLARSESGPSAFRGAPLGLRSFLEVFGPDLVDRQFLLIDAETGGRPMVDALREATIPARPADSGMAILDFSALVRLRRFPSLGASDLVFADLPPGVSPARMERGELMDPSVVRRRLGSRFLYSGKDDVLMTVHVRERTDALRLCAFTLRRYLRYYRPDQAGADSPPIEIIEEIGDGLDQRYLILPEAGPQEEGSSIALDLYEGQRFWKTGVQGSLERRARLLYEPESATWSVRRLS